MRIIIAAIDIGIGHRQGRFELARYFTKFVGIIGKHTKTAPRDPKVAPQMQAMHSKTAPRQEKVISSLGVLYDWKTVKRGKK